MAKQNKMWTAVVGSSSTVDDTHDHRYVHRPSAAVRLCCANRGRVCLDFRSHRESRRTAAPKSRTRGERAYRQLHARRAPFKDINTTASTCLESTRDTADAAAATSGSSDTAAAADTSQESRGRTRRRSLSWHCRQRLGGDLRQSPATTPTYASSTFCPSPSTFSSYNNANMLIDNSSRITGSFSCCSTPRQQYFCSGSMLRSTSCGSSVSIGNEAAGERERETRREARRWWSGDPGKERGSGGAERGESIDAEELFRRKNKVPPMKFCCTTSTQVV